MYILAHHRVLTQTEIQIKQLWPEHAASRQRAYQRHCEVHQAASNIRNVFLKMSGFEI